MQCLWGKPLRCISLCENYIYFSFPEKQTKESNNKSKLVYWGGGNRKITSLQPACATTQKGLFCPEMILFSGKLSWIYKAHRPPPKLWFLSAPRWGGIFSSLSHRHGTQPARTAEIPSWIPYLIHCRSLKSVLYGVWKFPLKSKTKNHRWQQRALFPVLWL